MDDRQPTSPQDDDKAPAAEEARTLIDALLDDVITEQGRARLEELVISDPAIARIYVRAMHLWSQLPLHLGTRQSMPATWQSEASSELLSGETMVMDALKLAPSTEDTFGGDIFQPAPASFDQPRQTGVWHKVYALRKWIGIAAAVGVAVTGTWMVWPAGPPAVVTATAGLVADSGTALEPGGSLRLGQLIDLKRGGVELKFRTGATVTVEGPAQFTLDQKNAMTLRSGTLAAYVPHKGAGFSVNSPGLKVVDLGTRFGIRTVESGDGSEAAVFEGNVTAAATDLQGVSISPPLPMAVATAVVHTVTARSGPAPSVYAPNQFPRDISKIRLPLKLYDTGAELNSDGGDAHWLVQQVALQPDWVPQSAGIFHPSAPAIALLGQACISPRNVTSPPPAGEYVFQTTLDLTGFDTNSAKVVAHLFATEAILDIRINGTLVVGVSLLDASNGDSPRPRELPFPSKYWKEGNNTIEFVMNYLPDDLPRYAFAGLHVAWDATASPLVKR